MAKSLHEKMAKKSAQGELRIPLKKIARDAGDVDPRLARRILRDHKKRPGGRWSWPKNEAAKIVEFLKQEVANGRNH